MTALANLSKFTGCYNEWLKIRQRYNMKWSKGDSIASFERFFDDELNYDVMLQRVRVPDQTRGKQKGIKMDICAFAARFTLHTYDNVESNQRL